MALKKKPHHHHDPRTITTATSPDPVKERGKEIKKKKREREKQHQNTIRITTTILFILSLLSTAWLLFLLHLSGLRFVWNRTRLLSCRLHSDDTRASFVFSFSHHRFVFSSQRPFSEENEKKKKTKKKRREEKKRGKDLRGPLLSFTVSFTVHQKPTNSWSIYNRTGDCDSCIPRKRTSDGQKRVESPKDPGSYLQLHHHCLDPETTDTSLAQSRESDRR